MKFKSWERSVPYLLAFLAVLLFIRHLVGPNTLLNDDLGCQYYPMRVFLRDEMRAGHFPLWNPYLYAGIPVAGDVEDAIFYPLNWLILAIPIERFFAWMAVFHCWLAAWGTYRCCRSLKFSLQSSCLAGVTFGLGGAMAASTYSGVHLYVQAWLPWSFWALLEGRWIWLACTIAAQILAGSPQFFVYDWLFCLYFGVLVIAPMKGWKPTARCFALGSSFGALLASIQLLPFVEMILTSSRREVAQNQHMSQYSKLEWGWGWLLPERVWSESQPVHQAYFLATSSLILAALAFWSGHRSSRLFKSGLVFITFCVLAAADFAPATALLRVAVPGYSMLRCQIRWLSVTLFATTFLAAMGWETVQRNVKSRRLQFGLLMAAAANVIGLTWYFQPLTATVEGVAEPEQFAQIFQGAPTDSRAMICPLLEMRYLNWAQIPHYATASGYSAMVVGDYLSFVAYGAKGRMLNIEEQKLLNLMSNIVPWTHFNENFARVLNLGTTAAIPPGGSLVVSHFQPGLARWRVVHASEVQTDMVATYARLAQADFDPSNTVILSAPPATQAPANDSPAGVDSVKLLDFQANSLEFEVESKTSGHLVLSETYYPGWTAQVDGQPAELVRAYWAFRAVPVGPGKHRVQILFRPASVKLGAVLTILTAAGLLLYAARLRFRPTK